MGQLGKGGGVQIAATVVHLQAGSKDSYVLLCEALCDCAERAVTCHALQTRSDVRKTRSDQDMVEKES